MPDASPMARPMPAMRLALPNTADIAQCDREKLLTRFDYEVGNNHNVVILSDMYGAWAGPGCGGNVWASGPALLNWLDKTADRRALIADSSCLELGAGLGLAGMGLLKMGARTAHLTDLPKQMPLLRHNVAANFESDDPNAPTVSPLVWGTMPAVAGDETWDLLLGTDLLYNEEHVAPLAATVHGLLSRRPTARALFAFPRRFEFDPGYSRNRGAGEVLPDYMLLFDLLADGGWHCEQIGSVSSEEAGTAENPISIWLVCAPAAASG